jgi:EAL domain-containing protein (putative c-di-GMP-specific phosphodiesterase class I)/GGDEF domain-containing protein
MLLPQTKEREYRFKLALRMGLPIFALILALVSHTLIENYNTLQASFYLESALLLVVSIYFIFYLIYSGFDVKISDNVTKTFTREYLFSYLQKELELQKEQTFILISIDNLSDINTLYGMKNGDKVLQKIVEWLAEYFSNEKIENFPIGHIKGGDFILLFNGKKSQYNSLLELLCLKSQELKIDDIEVKISGALTDTSYSRDLSYIVDKLFELQEKKRSDKNRDYEESLNPNELEVMVVNAIKNRNIEIMTQSVYEGEEILFKECFVKLKTKENKPIFPKTYLKAINKLGLGVEYDLMVLEVVTNFKENRTFTYAINVSPTSLRNEKYFNRAKELLQNSGKKIIFVLSEQEYYSYTIKYNAQLLMLKSLGALIAIDRVGSLHSSFLYLRELEVDIIRFDTYYSHENKFLSNEAVIDGFVVMAKHKNIKTWIKNIDSTELLELAHERKIDFIQGKQLSDLDPFISL